MANPIAWTIDKIKNFNDLVWHTPFSKMTKRTTFLLKQVRILYIAIKGFLKDKVQTQASALTLDTLLAVIPIAAIAFAIAKGFGLEQNLMDVLSREFQSQQEILNWLLINAQSALQQTRGGYLAGIGAVILIYSVMSLLSNVESSFNHIWQISESRNYARKFADYLTIMLIAPVFMVLSGSITVFISTQLVDFISSSSILAFFKPIVGFLIKLVPYVITWFVLTVIYIVLPNTKVKFGPAFVAGIICGTALKVLIWLYIDMQVGITKLSAIYGSFAAIPLLIIWLQTSWLIILLGAELSFANQNVAQYEQEAEALNISNFQKRSLSLVVMHMLVKNFISGAGPVSASEIGRYFSLPVRLVRDIIKNLHDIELVSRVHKSDDEKENYYQPAIDVNLITVTSLLNKLDKHGSENKLEIDNKDYEAIVALLKKYDKHLSKSELNIKLQDL